jgi:2,4-dienoyl-CoA reductase (NADPH2)
MSERKILSTIQDFVNCAALAQESGYDGVEIMGSEGYLLNQFLAEKTNKRRDKWGGNFENRSRFVLEIVRQTRERVGADFVIMYRISMLDLVENGSTIEETLKLAQKLEKLGVTVFNTGIGWHESRVPTIATSVPRASFAWVTQKLKSHVNIPVVAVNRINTPEVAEKLLNEGFCDMVSMARPFLADAQFVEKVARGGAAEVNTCIGCNQGCLDLVFQNKRATCLVNARACYETEMPVTATSLKKNIAVVGAGPAGLAFAVTAAERGHAVTLFDADKEIGGQFNYAKKIPGKAEFYETLRYFSKKIELLGVKLELGQRMTAENLVAKKFDEIIVATGVRPREVKVQGFESPKVISYVDVLSGKVEVGPRVAIIGAGGIGFDVAMYLTHEKHERSVEEFLSRWGVSKDLKKPGAVQTRAEVRARSKAQENSTEKSPEVRSEKKPTRQIFLMQRKVGKLGATLGKTTGWIHRTELADAGVEFLNGVSYVKFDEQGLHITLREKPNVLDVDHVVICAGQEVENKLGIELLALGQKSHIIGGAFEAAELDAKKAILQGTKLALEI